MHLFYIPNYYILNIPFITGGSNVAVIDPQKRQVKKIAVQKNLPKKLTKKQRRKLEAVLRRKAKKEKVCCYYVQIFKLIKNSQIDLYINFI